MAQVSLTREIKASRQRVWELVDDLPGYAEWLVIHRAWRGEVPDELSPGATFASTVSVKGIVNPIDWAVSDYDAPRRLGLSGTGPLGLKVTLALTVSEQEETTVLALETSFSGGPLIGPMGKLVERAAKGDIRKSLDNLAGLA